MKKTVILGLCLAFGLGASAQTKLVKEVERNTKNNYVEAAKQMQPAFTDPETANDAYPRYVVGKAGFDQYDSDFGKKQLGMPVDDIVMSDALLGGYDYMMQAIALDTIIDPKGKVKTKYSKNVINTVAGHFNDFLTAAGTYWNAQNYKGALNSWKAYTDLARDARFAKHIQAPADTTLQDFIFNQAIACFQLQDYPGALDKFIETMNVGPAKKQVYDYALSVASQLDRLDTIVLVCEKAMPIYGEGDNSYLINIINVYNRKGDYNNADRLINEALAKEPANAELWRVKGYLQEYQDKSDDALESYKKSVESDGNYANGLYDYARAIYNKGMRLEDATSQADYGRVYKEQLIPMYKESKAMLEKAASITNDDHLQDQIEKLLSNVNYKLGQE